jgi:hypothetical protein
MMNIFSWLASLLADWYWALQAISVFLVGVTVIIGGLTILAGREANRRQAEKLLTLETALSDAKKEQAKAEASVLELESRARARHFVWEIAATLKGKPTGSAEILYDPTVPDAYSPLGREIRGALQHAGWNVAPLRPISHPVGVHGNILGVQPTPHGITIFGLLDSCPKDTAYCALLTALSDSGLETVASRDEDMPKDSFRIIIGPRPPLPPPATKK